MSTTTLWRRHVITCVWLATLPLLATAACGPAGDDGVQWPVVLEYLDQQAAWEAQAGNIGDILRAGGGPLDEKLQRAEEAHGRLPVAAPAIAAAREMVATGGPHTAEAAMFLIERSESPLGMMETQPKLANLVAGGIDPSEAVARLRATEDPTWEALITHVGPDWTLVQKYLDEYDTWFARFRAAALAGGESPRVDMHEQPSAIRAIAAARAILGAEGAQEKTVEAVEFLVDHAPHRDRHLAAAARVLVARAPDYGDWLRVLRALDGARSHAEMTGALVTSVGEFFAEMASDADNPVLRAAARYYVAAGLMRGANAWTLSPEDRAARRESALETATGLSAGVEDETFDDPSRESADAAPVARTFAHAEADLIASIRHATVGGTLPERTGRRLDGMDEPLSAYRGRVLLIDFWATWCPPCIAALPKLRQLVSDLPADRFALLAISVDADLATVTEFITKEPMPWYNWHVGVSSDLARILDVRGVPTYLVVDADGTILFNGNAPLSLLRCMAERAVAGEDPNCSPADWHGAP